MQRSQVKQFKASNSTVFQSTFLGTHSTLALRQNSPYTELATMTSRIQHLPADTHVDLSNEPKTVLVFQAIEIERLSNEINLLRVCLREREDKVINANSYQVQIKELVERCNRLQSEKYSFREQLGQTKDMNDMLFNQLSELKARYEEVDCSASEKYKLEKARNEELALEIQKWKGRYTSLDKAKGEDAETARRAIQLQRQSQFNSGSKELIIRFQIEREELLGRLRQKKQELNERDLQLKKLGNFYQQAQVKLQEQDHSIESYEQKVAMLSQETYRLNELLRIKGEQIKNLKMTNDNDLSLRLSQFTVMDATKDKLSSKLRSIEDSNEQLREALKVAEGQTNKLKIKASEAERLEYQVREARKEAENKMKAMERKDKRIIILEEQIKKYKILEDELASFRRLNQDLGGKIQDLQIRISQKVDQLKRVQLKCGQLQKEYMGQMSRLSDKVQQYEQLYKSVESNYRKLMSNEAEVQQKSSYFELQVREHALNLKEKDYKISSLLGQLKDVQSKMKAESDRSNSVTLQLQAQLFLERRTFESKTRDSQSIRRQIQTLTRQQQHKDKATQLKLKQSEQRLKDVQIRCRQLQTLHNRKEDEINQLKNVISRLIRLQDQLTDKQNQMSGEIKVFQMRLGRIQEIIINLRNSLAQRYRAAEENQQKLKLTQSHVDQMQEWFIRIAERINQSPTKYSPSPSPRKRQSDRSISPPRSRPFFSPELTPTYQHNYAQSSSIYGFKEMQSDNTRVSSSLQELPIEWMMRFVLLCAEVQSLRKKVGDKQAKVQSMKSSIASKVGSNSTLINHLHGSNSSTHSGFLTTRQNTLSRKPNIYY